MSIESLLMGFFRLYRMLLHRQHVSLYWFRIVLEMFYYQHVGEIIPTLFIFNNTRKHIYILSQLAICVLRFYTKCKIIQHVCFDDIPFY